MIFICLLFCQYNTGVVAVGRSTCCAFVNIAAGLQQMLMTMCFADPIAGKGDHAILARRQIHLQAHQAAQADGGIFPIGQHRTAGDDIRCRIYGKNKLQRNIEGLFFEEEAESSILFVSTMQKTA